VVINEASADNLPSGKAKIARSNDSSNEIEDEKTEINAYVPPAVREFDVEWQEELVTNLILAVPTPRGIIRVVKVPASSVHEVTRPRPARLARWRIEHSKFLGLTRYL
jgi:hypothetical protein